MDLGTIFAPVGAAGLPPLALLAVAIIMPLTTRCAVIDVKLAHTTPQRALRLSYDLFLALTMARMFWDLVMPMSGQ